MPLRSPLTRCLYGRALDGELRWWIIALKVLISIIFLPDGTAGSTEYVAEKAGR